MSLSGKIEKDVEIQSSADIFSNVLSKQIHHAQSACPGVHGIEVHEGDIQSPGSVKQWRHSIDGKTVEVFKEKIHVDTEKKLLTFESLEGSSVLERFKVYKLYVEIISKIEGQGSLVKTIIEYEKLNEDVPAPEKEFEFVIQILKDIDAHLCKKDKDRIMLPCK